MGCRVGLRSESIMSGLRTRAQAEGLGIFGTSYRTGGTRMVSGPLIYRELEPILRLARSLSGTLTDSKEAKPELVADLNVIVDALEQLAVNTDNVKDRKTKKYQQLFKKLRGIVISSLVATKSKRSIRTTVSSIHPRSNNRDARVLLLSSLLTNFLSKQSLASRSINQNVILISILFDSLDRLVSFNPTEQNKDLINGFESQMITNVIDEVLSSKKFIPITVTSSLNNFLISKVSSEKFITEIAKPSEKMLLRSPEIVLFTLASFVASTGFNISGVYKDIFINPLINTHIKASSVQVKDGAKLLINALNLKSWKYITNDNKDEIEASITYIVDSILQGISKVSSIDHRLALYEVLENLYLSSEKVNSLLVKNIISKISILITSKFPGLFLKENETNATILFNALRPYLLSSITETSDKAGFSWILTNIKSAKLENRRSAFILLHDVIKNLSEECVPISDLKSSIDISCTFIESVSKSTTNLLDASKKSSASLAEGYIVLSTLLFILDTYSIKDKSIEVRNELYEYTKTKLMDNGLLKTILVGDGKKLSVFFDTKYFTRLIDNAVDFSYFTQFVDTLILGPGSSLLTEIGKTTMGKLLMHVTLFSKDFVSLKRHFELISESANDTSNNSKYEFLVDVTASSALEYLKEHDASSNIISKELAFESNDVPALDIWNSTPTRDSGNPLVRIMYALSANIPKITGEEEHNVSGLSLRRTETLIRFLILTSYPEMCYVHGSDLWIRMCFFSGTTPSEVLKSESIATLVEDWLSAKTIANGCIGEIEIPSSLRPPENLTNQSKAAVTSKAASKIVSRSKEIGAASGSPRSSTTAAPAIEDNIETESTITINRATFRAIKLLTQVIPKVILPVIIKFLISTYIRTINLFDSVEYEDLMEMFMYAEDELLNSNKDDKSTANSVRESQKQNGDIKSKSGKSKGNNVSTISPSQFQIQELLKLFTPFIRLLRIHRDVISTVGDVMNSSLLELNAEEENINDDATVDIQTLSIQLHFTSLSLISRFLIGQPISSNKLPINFNTSDKPMESRPKILFKLNEILQLLNTVGIEYSQMLFSNVENSGIKSDLKDEDEGFGGEGADLFVVIPDNNTFAKQAWEMSVLSGANGGNIYSKELPTHLPSNIANWWSIKNVPRKPLFDESVIKSVMDTLGSIIQAQSDKTLSPTAFGMVFPLVKECIVETDGRITTSYREKIVLSSVSDILLTQSGLASYEYLPRYEWVKCIIGMIADYPSLRVAGREALLSFSISMTEDEDFNDEEEEEEEEESIIKATGKEELEVYNDADAVVRELLDGLLHKQTAVRIACVNALSNFMINKVNTNYFKTRVWVSTFDESIKDEADALWQTENFNIDINSIDELIKIATTPVEDVRKSAGMAICKALEGLDKSSLKSTLKKLCDLYKEKSKPPKPIYDKYGLIVVGSDKQVDPWECRVGVATVIESCARIIVDFELISFIFEFLITDKEYPALGDKDFRVSQAMLNSGLAIINNNSREQIQKLIPTLEGYLNDTNSKAERIKECCVILLGCIACHLDKSDPTVSKVVDKLLEALSTSSDDVQKAVMQCLPPLFKLTSGKTAPKLIESLLKQLFEGETRIIRKGAAYGIAGVVKGCGIGSLNDYQILSALKEAVQDKKSLERRESALIAIETLSYALGRLFEPYIVGILPYILMSFSASQKEVRQATEDACRVIMSRLSAYCVKLLLPSLLDSLQERQWRTQTASIEVLASMAYLAPRQLAVSLPLIIPKLGEAISDTHAKVQNAAKEALTTFGKVIKNPEIQELSPILIAALVDPSTKTEVALTSLLNISFVHYIDGPSLALLIPIIKRALSERSTEIKRKASQIMGNISSLTEPKDLIPYINGLIPGLKESLVDPVPEVRATSAKAFGRMMEHLGESNFPTLTAELTEMLQNSGGVDRSGAAQGLSEIISSFGLDRLRAMLPTIIANSNSSQANLRVGYMTLLIYLPATFGDKFQPFIGSIIPSVLRGLADENDTVRDASMKSAKMIVHNYATSAVDLLLPQLEAGLFNDNWRIRHASCQLVGSLLYRIAGVNNKANQFSVDESLPDLEHGRQSIIHTLGQERYNHVLASIYTCRSDPSIVVRNDAIHVWKSLVTNTPRTVKNIIGVILNICIRIIKSSNEERQTTAETAISEIILKNGSGILSAISPVIEKSASNLSDVETRSGTILILSVILSHLDKEGSEDFIETSIQLVRDALIDEFAEVREAGAISFDKLQQLIGRDAVDYILPDLLNKLRGHSQDDEVSEESTYILDALRKLMSVRANTIFPILIPTLLEKPISVFNVRALASLIEVSGPIISTRTADILDVLLSSLDDPECPSVEDFRNTLLALLSRVDGETALHEVLVTLEERARAPNVRSRITAINAFKLLCDSNIHGEIALDYITTWIFILIQGFNESFFTGLISSSKKFDKSFDKYSVKEKDCVIGYWEAFSSMCKCIPKSDIPAILPDIRTAIEYAEDDAVELSPEEGMVISAFELPKGIQPLFQLFVECLMHGNSSARTNAARGMNDLLKFTSSKSLKPFITLLAGPLIRVVGDRWPIEVKYAILECFEPLLKKLPIFIKPFIPQLQRTFVKALSEPTSPQYRRLGVERIRQLIPLQPRLDQLASEFTSGLKQVAINAQNVEQGGSAADATTTLNTYKDIMASYVISVGELLKFVESKGNSKTGLSDASILALGEAFKSIIGFCNKSFEDDPLLKVLNEPLSALLLEFQDSTRKLLENKHLFQLLSQFHSETYE